MRPSQQPSFRPSVCPSQQPSFRPSVRPSQQLSREPSNQPTVGASATCLPGKGCDCPLVIMPGIIPGSLGVHLSGVSSNVESYSSIGCTVASPNADLWYLYTATTTDMMRLNSCALSSQVVGFRLSQSGCPGACIGTSIQLCNTGPGMVIEWQALAGYSYIIESFNVAAPSCTSIPTYHYPQMNSLGVSLDPPPSGTSSVALDASSGPQLLPLSL